MNPNHPQSKPPVAVVNQRLSNGLDVFLLPMPGFHEVCGAIATSFGSIHSGQPLDETNPSIVVPEGAAHFLEHRLFDHPKGPIFDRYSARGAFANAFTSYDRTVYYFVSSSKAVLNTQLLIDLTQTFSMSEARVNREKDIIIEELKMYDDSPDTRLNRGLLELLYPQHPIRFDIGGTAQSVHATTRSLLELCHAKYYHPSNMMLVLAGDIEPQLVLTSLEKAIQRYPIRPSPTLPSLFTAVDEKNGKTYGRIHLPVAFPMMGHGFQLPATQSSDTPHERNRTTIVYEVLFDLLFSRSGPYYDKMVAKGIMTPSWSSDLVDGVGYRALLLNAEVLKPRLYAQSIDQLFSSPLASWLTFDDLHRVKNKMIGLHMRGLERPSSLALDYLGNRLDGVDVFDDIDALESLTMQDLHQAYYTVQRARRVRFDVYPLSQKGAS